MFCAESFRIRIRSRIHKRDQDQVVEKNPDQVQYKQLQNLAECWLKLSSIPFVNINPELMYICKTEWILPKYERHQATNKPEQVKYFSTPIQTRENSMAQCD